MKRLIPIYLLSLALFFCTTFAADTLFVSAIAEPGGNGQSWNVPYQFIDDAIDAWQPGDEIWIAKGSYAIQNAIVLDKSKSGIRLYAGFNGDELLREARDWYRNPTILTAQGQRLGILSMIDCDSLTRIDGLIFENADSIAVAVMGGAPHFRNCLFRNNTSSGSGAAMVISAIGRMRIEYCVFAGNTSAYNGGAVFVKSQTDPGGYRYGMFFGQCLFMNNSGSLGGAICLSNQEAISQFSSCAFYNNIGQYGGAVATEQSYVYLTNCTFVKNTLKGGALHSMSAYMNGGHIQNSIFWNGDLSDSGKHIADVDSGPNDTTTLTYIANLVEKDFTFGFWQSDPQFENIDNPLGPDGFFGTDDDGLRPTLQSSAVDGGILDKWVNTWQTDAIGNPRLVDRKIDLGIYEAQRPGRAGFRALVDEMKEGKLTIFFRHAKTDWSQKDPGPSPECFPGRNLIYEGREQSRTIGASMRRMNIPVGDVESSPVCRCWETAELMTGRYEIVSYWGSGGNEGRQKARDSSLSTTPVGGLRIVSSHDAVALLTFNADADGRDLTTAELMEGDCLFVRPLTDTFEIIGHWSSDTWERYHVRFPDAITSVADYRDFGSKTNSIHVYPQPASDVMYISAEYPDTYQVLDNNGRVMIRLAVGINYTVNTSHWAPGIYLLRGMNSRATFIVSN